jgi:N-acetylated-alpha-linked acidic dipeptidase
VVLRLANADILPYDYGEEARNLRAEVAPLDSVMRARRWSISTAPLSAAIDRMGQAADAFAATRDRVLGSELGAATRAAGSGGGRLPRSSADNANRALVRVERALTRPEGLRTRPWFRSLTYASDEDNGYADLALPSLAEAIESGDQPLAARELEDLVSRFDAAAAALHDAARALVPER